MDNLFKLLFLLAFSSTAFGTIDDGDFEKKGIWRSSLQTIEGKFVQRECRFIPKESLRDLHNNTVKLYVKLVQEKSPIVSEGRLTTGFFRVCEGEEHVNKAQTGRMCRRNDGADAYTEGYFFSAPGIVSSNYLTEYGCKNHSAKVKKMTDCVGRTGDNNGCISTFAASFVFENSSLMAPPPEDIRAAREAQNPINILVRANNQRLAQDKVDSEARAKKIKNATGSSLENRIAKDYYYIFENNIHGKVADFFGSGCDQKVNDDVKTFNERIAEKTKQLVDYEGLTCESGIKGDYGVVLCKGAEKDRKTFIITNEYEVCLREVAKYEESMKKNGVKIK